MTTAVHHPRTPAGKIAAAPRYQNAAEFIQDLGEVPLERIIFDPWPGTATEADLLQKLETENHPCELIDGILVEKPMGHYESTVALLLARVLLDFILPRRLGAVAGADGPLRFRIGLVRLPDVSFISADRMKGAAAPREQIPSLIPDLAVEILSPGNTKKEMERKRQDYFGAGVRLVWILDPATRSAEAYRDVKQARYIDRDGMLDGEDILPGFQSSLADLFRAADEMWNLNA